MPDPRSNSTHMYVCIGVLKSINWWLLWPNPMYVYVCMDVPKYINRLIVQVFGHMPPISLTFLTKIDWLNGKYI